jgi:serine/threonine-protein kinase HipA
MGRQLDVFLHGHPAGQLENIGGGEMRFVYAPDQLARRIPLSLSLRKQREQGPQVRNWFANLLPEGGARQRVCQQTGLTLHDDFGLLAALGRDCAGAVTLLPQGETATPPSVQTFYPLTHADIEAWIASPRQTLAGSGDLPRLSLAGAQHKTALLAFDDGSLARPVDGTPSTHILKIANPAFPELVTLEAFGMRLAEAVGISVATVRLLATPSVSLLVERYDRRMESTLPRRVHQEDICQALGIAPEHKYQEDGGPSAAQMFTLLRRAGSDPRRLRQLLDLVLFNVVIGNADAHGKNYSLLLHEDGHVALAPAYDLVPTAAYAAISRQLAMPIGGATQLDMITPDDLDRLAKDIRMSVGLVRAAASGLADRVLAGIPAVAERLIRAGGNRSVIDQVAGMVGARASAVRDRRPLPADPGFIAASVASATAWDR